MLDATIRWLKRVLFLHGFLIFFCCLGPEISKSAYDIESYKQIMGVIARRLQDSGEDWRHVYKSLLLLEFLCKHGPQKVYLLNLCVQRVDADFLFGPCELMFSYQFCMLEMALPW